MRNIVMYLIVMVITAYIEIMYEDSMAVTFLALEVLLAVVLLVSVRYMRKHIKVTLQSLIPVVQKGEEMDIIIKVDNTGVLPVTRMELQLSYENEYSAATEYDTLSVSVGAGDSATVVYKARTNYCGKINFYFPRGRVFDYIGLLCAKVSCDQEVQYNVLPDVRTMPLVIHDSLRSGGTDSEYQRNMRGEDLSEIYDIRAFRDGDTLQKVHWKLSAKADEWLIKEFGSNIPCTVLLLIDLHHESGLECGIKRMDSFMEITASLLFSLCQEQVFFCSAWYDEEEGRILRHFVANEEDVYEVIDRILNVMCYVEKYDLYQGYLARYPESHFDTVLSVDTSLAITRNDEKAMAFFPEELAAQLESKVLEL